MITIDRDTARTGSQVTGRPGSARGIAGACLRRGGLR